MRTRSKNIKGEVMSPPARAVTVPKLKPKEKGLSKNQSTVCGLVQINMRTRSQKKIEPSRSEAVIVVKNSPMKKMAKHMIASKNSNENVGVESSLTMKLRTRTQKNLDAPPEESNVIAAARPKSKPQCQSDDAKVTAAPAKPQRSNKKGKGANKMTVATTSSLAFKVGELCFAKVKGYCEWPAFVTSVGKNFVWVKFFNSGEIAKCYYGSIFNMEESIMFLPGPRVGNGRLTKRQAQLEKAKKEMVVALRQQLDDDIVAKKSRIVQEYLRILQY